MLLGPLVGPVGVHVLVVVVEANLEGRWLCYFVFYTNALSCLFTAPLVVLEALESAITCPRSKLHRAYSLFYVIGTLGAIRARYA